MTINWAHAKPLIKPAILLLAGLALLVYIKHLEHKSDAIIAQHMADRVMAKHRAERDAIIAKYAPLNAALAAEAAALQQGNQALAAKVVAKQRQLVLKEGTLAEVRAKLEECSSFLGSISYEYNEQLVKAEKLRLEQLALKDAEIAEWRAKDEASIITIGQLTKRVVMLTLDKRKRLILGPQIHYGTAGMSIGFGATLDIGLRFRLGGLL